MSRSGYSEELENWDLIRWRGQVASSIRGKRGQKMLCDLLSALDAMPKKALIKHELEDEEGQVCTLGALGRAKGIDMKTLDPDEPDEAAAAFDIARPLAAEIVYQNDECFDRFWDGRTWVDVTPEQRWKMMRDWVSSLILRAARDKEGQ